MRAATIGRGKAGALLLWTLLIFLNVIGLLRLPVYPFDDLPNHLAEATIFKHRHDADSPLSTAYRSTVTIYQPAIAHIVLCSLFPSVEAGNKILYVFYVLAVPGLVFLISRQCRGDPLVPALSVITLWNYCTTMGFSGFTLSIPVTLLYLYLHIRFLEQRRAWTLVCLGAVLVVLYWFHALAFLFAAACFAGLEFFHALGTRSWRPLLWSWLPLLPAGALMCFWIAHGSEFHGESTIGFLKRYYAREFLPQVVDRFLALGTNDGHAIAHAGYGRNLALLFNAAILVPALVCVARYPVASFRMSVPQRCTAAVALIALLCFYLLPDQLRGEPVVYQRFSVFALLALVCCLSWAWPLCCARVPRSLIVVAALAYSAAWCQYFMRFNRTAQEFAEFFPRDPQVAHSVVASLIDRVDYRGRPALIHFNNYQIIWNEGVTPAKFIEYRFGAIRPGEKPPPGYYGWNGYDYVGEKGLAGALHHYNGIDYLIAEGKDLINVLAARSDYTLVRRTEHWALFEPTKLAAR